MSEENTEKIEEVVTNPEQYIKELELEGARLLERVTELNEELERKPDDWSMSSKKTKGVDTALSKAQAEWHGGVEQGGVNPHFSNPQEGRIARFIELRDMVKVAAPILSKHGLSVTQATVPKLVNGQQRMFLRTRVSHGATESWHQSYWPMTPDKAGSQQALGKEHTYSRRQSYGGLLVIPPSIDDDGEASEGRNQ